jgi:hypothetical protein
MKSGWSGPRLATQELDMEPLIATLALFVFGGLATYTISERRHRHLWIRYGREPVDESHAPFRHPDGPPATRTVLVRDRAPATIRRTALWSIYLGQMSVPGGLLGLVGLVYGAGLGLLSIPGMILAVRIWRNAYAMLRQDPGAADEARKVSRFAVYLNAIAVALALVLPLIELAFIPVSLILVVYALISVGHAKALERCATILDDEHAKQDEHAKHADAATEARAEARA